ncbi:hypothetical protein RB195_005014 [Necator americanus]|uniref:Uncharacterized protein n=1 Tax=Necator americanus TaxID=51031 RepID=A0ABR1BKT6_NECAM
MTRCLPVLNTANGIAVRKVTLPIWREHFNALLNRQTPSAPDLKRFCRPTYAVNEKTPTELEALFCIQKMKDGKFGRDDAISESCRTEY